MLKIRADNLTNDETIVVMKTIVLQFVVVVVVLVTAVEMDTGAVEAELDVWIVEVHPNVVEEEGEADNTKDVDQTTVGSEMNVVMAVDNEVMAVDNVVMAADNEVIRAAATTEEAEA